MDAVKEGHKTSLSSGKIVALAAGLSVGATLGYIIYRHINGTKSSKYLPLNRYHSKPNLCMINIIFYFIMSLSVYD